MARNGDKHVDAPANVDIKAVVWSDPRFRMLAGQADIDVFSAIARCARVWAACTDRSSCSMAAADVDMFAERPGFGEAMVVARLARREDDGALYVCGTEGRIEWLEGLRELGKKGGEASAAARVARTGTGQPDGQAYAQAQGQPDGQAYGEADAQAAPKRSPTRAQPLFPSPVPVPTGDPDMRTPAERAPVQGKLLTLAPKPDFDFGALYKRYPRKLGKRKGMEACARLVKTQGDYELLSRGVDAYLAEVRRLRIPEDKQPYWSSFVNGEDWRVLAEATTTRPAERAPLEDDMAAGLVP